MQVSFGKKAVQMGKDTFDHEILMKYVGGLHSHLRRPILLAKPKDIDEACSQAHYLEMDEKKGPSPSSNSSNASKKKGGVNATSTIAKKDSTKHCGHCDVDGHTDETCWKLHPELHPFKNKKKKKKSMPSLQGEPIYVESNEEGDEQLCCTGLQKKVCLGNDDAQNKGEPSKLFHIKVQIKMVKVDALFYSCSQVNLIGKELVDRLGLEMYDHPNPYALGWVKKGVEIRVSKQCKVKFAINEHFIDEVVVDVAPIDICGIVFGSPYMYVRDVIFRRRLNQYQLVKDGKNYTINSYEGKSKLSLVSSTQGNQLFNVSGKVSFLILKDKQECKDLHSCSFDKEHEMQLPP
ncbi:hypothetical protein KI387_043202, partial [Taxus chinensis]